MPWSRSVWKVGICFLFVLLLDMQQTESTCQFPAYLSKVYEWSSDVTIRGNRVGKLYVFDNHTMNVSINAESPTEYFFKCHQSVAHDSFIVSEGLGANLTYKCVKFEKWSSNVIQIFESHTDASLSEALCEGNNLTADPWPLIWKYLDFGYIPCPDIGGYNMEVYDDQGQSLCGYLNPSRQSRFECECIYGEGIQMDFSLNLCKGDMPLARSERLLCLGHKKKGRDNHLIVTNNHDWPKIFSIKYREENKSDELNMYLSEDITLNLSRSEQGKTWNIVLKKKNYPTLCEDNYNNCKEPEMCSGYNLLHCQATCRNYTTCLSDKDVCSFENKLNGHWVEQSLSGTHNVKMFNHTALIDKLDTFKCLSILSSTRDGPTPVVKVLQNGCKPRFACLDIEYFNPNVVRYRLSQSIMWPYKENLVRGDVCHETLFEDDPYPFSFLYHSQHHKVLVKAPHSETNSGRTAVPCNIPYGISFTVDIDGERCTGSLNSCQSGYVMVMTYSTGCKIKERRTFHRCLAEYKTRSQQFIFTEKSDNPQDLFCWVFKEDLLGIRDNMFLQLHSGDCSNGTSVSLSGYNDRIPYISSFSYRAAGNDQNADSCLDMPSIPRRSATTESTTTASATTTTTTHTTPPLIRTTMDAKTDPETTERYASTTSIRLDQTSTTSTPRYLNKTVTTILASSPSSNPTTQVATDTTTQQTIEKSTPTTTTPTTVKKTTYTLPTSSISLTSTVTEAPVVHTSPTNSTTYKTSNTTTTNIPTTVTKITTTTANKPTTLRTSTTSKPRTTIQATTSSTATTSISTTMVTVPLSPSTTTTLKSSTQTIATIPSPKVTTKTATEATTRIQTESTPETSTLGDSHSKSNTKSTQSVPTVNRSEPTTSQILSTTMIQSTHSRSSTTMSPVSPTKMNVSTVVTHKSTYEPPTQSIGTSVGRTGIGVSITTPEDASKTRKTNKPENEVEKEVFGENKLIPEPVFSSAGHTHRLSNSYCLMSLAILLLFQIRL